MFSFLIFSTILSTNWSTVGFLYYAFKTAIIWFISYRLCLDVLELMNQEVWSWSVGF